MTLFQDSLTAAFSQSGTLNSMFPEGHACRSGVCFALSIAWIARHRSHKGESATQRLAAVGSKDSVMKASVTQRLYGAEFVNGGWRGMDHTAAQNAAMDHLGMGYKAGGFEKSVNYSDDDSVKAILAALETRAGQTHEYNLVSFDFVTGGGHATCCYKSSGKFAGFGSHLYVFDPNFGEFKVAGGQIKAFYKAFFDRYATHKTSDGKADPHKIKKLSIRAVA